MWYSTEVHLSQQQAYIVGYLRSLVLQSWPEKIGMAALIASLSAGFHDFAAAFWAVIGFWVADMLTGTIRAWRDPAEKLSYSKALDGVSRLVVIVSFAVVLLLVEVAFADALAAIADVTWDANGKFMLGGLGVLGVHELISVTQNVEWFYPGVRRFRGRFIRWREGEPIQHRPARAVVISDHPGEEP